MKNLKAWSGITNQLYIWHYNTNFSHYLLPFPDFDELAADIPMYRRHGVAGLFLEGAYAPGGGAENAELRSYVMAKLLWDTNANVEKLIDEFHASYYGKSARFMRQYFDLLHREVRMPPSGLGQHIWIYGVPDYREDLLRQARDLFRRAEAVAESNTVRVRIQKARLSLDYVGLLQSMKFAVKEGQYTPADLNALKTQFEQFLVRVGRFGITELHEGSKLAEDERRFNNYVRSYRVATLENSSLRVDVVPELSGRVVRMIDKKTGRNLLRRLDPGEYENPDTGGLAVFVSPDFYSSPLETRWQLDSMEGPHHLTLTGTAANGFRLNRILRLSDEGAVLDTETVLEASGTEPVEVVLQSRFEADPDGIDDVVLAFRKQDGTAFEEKLIQPEKQPSGSDIFIGSGLPDGQWQLLSKGQTPVLLNRFQKQQVGRCSLDWEGRRNPNVVLTVWSNKRNLAPGQRLELDASYRVK
jgi:hypothetical protein